MIPFTIRQTTPDDTSEIAKLHARSWMLAYRGLLSDEYLDNDLHGERLNYWSKKVTQLTDKEFILVAESEGKVIGFIAVMDQPDAGYDALVDNLHVQPDLKGLGVGGALMKEAAERLLATGRRNFYLWVLHGNASAEQFYLSKGATAEDDKRQLFGGKSVSARRFAWRSFDRFLTAT